MQNIQKSINFQNNWTQKSNHKILKHHVKSQLGINMFSSLQVSNTFFFKHINLLALTFYYFKFFFCKIINLNSNHSRHTCKVFEASVDGWDIFEARVDGCDVAKVVVDGCDVFEAHVDSCDIFDASVDGVDVLEALVCVD